MGTGRPKGKDRQPARVYRSAGAARDRSTHRQAALLAAKAHFGIEEVSAAPDGVALLASEEQDRCVSGGLVEGDRGAGGSHGGYPTVRIPECRRRDGGAHDEL